MKREADTETTQNWLFPEYVLNRAVQEDVGQNRDTEPMVLEDKFLFGLNDCNYDNLSFRHEKKVCLLQIAIPIKYFCMYWDTPSAHTVEVSNRTSTYFSQTWEKLWMNTV